MTMATLVIALQRSRRLTSGIVWSRYPQSLWKSKAAGACLQWTAIYFLEYPTQPCLRHCRMANPRIYSSHISKLGRLCCKREESETPRSRRYAKTPSETYIGASRGTLILLNFRECDAAILVANRKIESLFQVPLAPQHEVELITRISYDQAGSGLGSVMEPNLSISASDAHGPSAAICSGVRSSAANTRRSRRLRR
jgi:hypothetical protein